MQPARITSIDTVRGVAVLGILVMNVIGMAYAGAAYLNPIYAGGAEPANMWLWAVAYVTVDGKMRALFAMLFGASLLLMAESGPAEGATRRHLARMAVLFLIGLAHGSLLWAGDILLPFALVGLAVWPLRRQPPSRLFLLGVIALGLQVAINLSFGMQALAAQAAAAAPDASQAVLDAWASLRSVTYTDPADVARETAMYRGSPGQILAIRHEAVMFARFFLLPFTFFAESVGLLLIGMGLYRLGWWQGGFDGAHYRKLALALILPGWAIGVFLAWRFFVSGFSAPAFFFTDSARVLVAPAVAVGYAALIIAAVKSGAFPRLVARLAACGRMALSNYVAASLLGNLIFTGIGLGLFGELSRPQVMLVVLGIWALQLAWSRPWLEHFRYGPLEWLWRSLARGRPQPFRSPAYP
ncbi:DUF418 domain-containing protein [Sandaracinobacter sp. RS1-74]|uniref:DUF418 domain-containing protein n=1 Tax=Sandaracinobacteroides sayramensis TaxID=2913411 RepID=UPI001EDC5889|nr:DUF418 domain-containing protein [Sandaracinobacteroides sayramensis]MCG2840164.1 DUF418 domain-containing protein [Sandaracinobacteroides sayramensis]